VTVGPGVIALVAMLAGAAAWLLTGTLRAASERDSPWLRRGVHVLLAAAGAAGGAALARTWADCLAYGFAAVAAALLVMLDLTEQRLPDRLTLPSYPMLFGLFALAAATHGGWPGMARAIVAGAATFVGYLVIVLVLPGGFYFGDAKLGGLVGAFLGWFGWGPLALGLAASWLALGLAGVLVVATGRGGRRTELAFGPFMVLGAALGVAWGAQVFPRLG